MYSRDCRISNYYYDTVQVNAVKSGSYSLLGKSKSNVRIYGYIYEHNFNPLNPFENLLLENGFSCGDRQFILTYTLRSGTTYILVVTTFSPNETGEFSIIASGPNHVTLSYFCEYMYCLVYNQHRSINTENVCKLNLHSHCTKGFIKSSVKQKLTFSEKVS